MTNTAIQIMDTAIIAFLTASGFYGKTPEELISKMGHTAYFRYNALERARYEAMEIESEEEEC